MSEINYPEVLQILDEAFENNFGMSYKSALDDNSGCYISRGGLWMSPQSCAAIAGHVVDNLYAMLAFDGDFDLIRFNDWVREQPEEGDEEEDEDHDQEAIDARGDDIDAEPYEDNDDE